MKEKIQVVTIDGAIDEIEFEKFKPSVNDRIKELELSLLQHKKESAYLKTKNRRLSLINDVFFISAITSTSMLIMAVIKIWQVVE